MAKQKSSAPGGKIIDGVKFPPNWLDFHCQLWLFHFAPKLVPDPFWRPENTLDGNPSSQPYTGTGRFSHARVLAEMLVQKFEFHDWSEKALRTFSENIETAICGGGGSSKSTSAAMYGLLFWMCAPADTAVLIASTTIDAALQRIWKNVGEFYSEMSRVSGGLGTSMMAGKPKPQIRSAPKDFAHGLFIVAVAQGDIQKAIDELKGRHPKRLLVIGDETDSISQAIVDVCANLRIGTLEFQAIWLGNLPSAFNPLGNLMEPEPGRPVSESCGSEWTSTKGVKCLRFDGLDSPNIRDNDKWSGLVRAKDIEAIAKRYGANSPQYYIMVRGLPPPEGADDTVLSEAALFRFHARDSVTWERSFITSAMLDPGFGGDPCIYRTFKRGNDMEGKMRILLDEIIPIPITASDPANPAEYQIAQKVKSLCESRAIPPEEFIADTTGIGRGVGAVLQREWSPRINLCEFGGACSDMIVSDEDPRPSKELYDRQVTELWFSIREFVHADMIRGLDLATANQLCQRRHFVKGTGSGKRTALEKKEDMKLRGLTSPNEADALACGIRLLRLKGINASIQTEAKTHVHDHLLREVAEQDFDSREDCYAEEFV